MLYIVVTTIVQPRDPGGDIRQIKYKLADNIEIIINRQVGKFFRILYIRLY